MITRPLDLAAKLRPGPRNFDALFFVNAGLLVLFFSLFGSRFVLAPGLELRVPAVAGSDANAVPTTDSITILNAGQILAGDGPRDVAQLRVWLAGQAQARVQQRQNPTLLIITGPQVTVPIASEIAAMASAAGFKTVQLATAEPGSAAAREP